MEQRPAWVGNVDTSIATTTRETIDRHTCGSVIGHVTEYRKIGGNTPPAFMGPEEPFVVIRCARCGDLLDQFGA